MDKATFERLRATPNKVIEGNVVLRSKKDTSPVLVSDKVKVMLGADVIGHLSVRYNPETGAKTVNASIDGIGPICRLDVDDRPHGAFGRSHKHELDSEGCPSENLKRCLLDMSVLGGQTMEEVLNQFCAMANIDHQGELRMSE